MRICKEWTGGKQIKRRTQTKSGTIFKKTKHLKHYRKLQNGNKNKNACEQEKKGNWIETKTKEENWFVIFFLFHSQDSDF